jgi:hypothetical protein
MTPAYLAADAARLADAEPPRTVPVPLPTVSDTHLTELDFAADLFRRADRALSGEVEVLRGLPLGIDWSAVQDACRTLVSTAVQLHIHALQARAGRPA